MTNNTTDAKSIAVVTTKKVLEQVYELWHDNLETMIIHRDINDFPKNIKKMLKRSNIFLKDISILKKFEINQRKNFYEGNVTILV